MKKKDLYCKIQGEGKPIVLIHGWTMNSGVWTYFTRAFARQYKVITLDLRGHGKSAAMPGPYDFNQFANDVSELLNVLRLHHVTLIGWSMGVSVILKMFEKQVPAVDSLVFIDGAPSIVRRDGYTAGIARGESQALFRQIRTDYEVGMKNFYTLLFHNHELSLKQRKVLYPLVADTNKLPKEEVALKSLRSLQTEDLRCALRNIHVPVLLIHGEHDRVCAADASRYMHAHLAHSKLVVFKDTGHAPFLTRKKQVHDLIKHFLQGISWQK